MRRPVAIALVLLVLLPLALLGWFAARLTASERAALEHQLRTLVDAELAAVDAELGGYLRALGARLAAAAERLPVDARALREFARRAPLVRQPFALGADGARLHPPADAELSADEREFLTRTRRIWRDQSLVIRDGGERAGDTQASGPPQSRTTVSGPPDAGPPDAGGPDTGGPDAGWYVWYWGEETLLLYWRRRTDGRLLGFELEPVRLLAELINRLPASGGPRDRLGRARVRLTDGRNTLLYQWGGFEPPAAARPLAVRPLSHPLGGWQLAYFAPRSSAGERWLLTAAVVLGCAAALFGLAVYLYRDHRRAARLAQQRVNFVNQVSHELKTPLTNIRLYAELLDDELDEDRPQPRERLRVIVAESQRLSRLINNVLSFASLQKNRLQPRYRQTSLDTIVNTALDAHRPALAAKGVRAEFKPGAGRVCGLDPDLIEQIVSNLLSNVEKYAASGGRVTLASGWRDGRPWLTVRDFGPGVPARERGRVFRPFYRLSSRLSDGVTGTGIGLAIARDLARLHGGDLRLVDRDHGACFELSLTPGEGP